MTSDGMVAPSYWIDPRSGNNYMVTVQYANRWLNNMSIDDLKNIPLRGVRPPGYSPANEGGAASVMPSSFLDFRPLRGVHASQSPSPTSIH